MDFTCFFKYCLYTQEILNKFYTQEILDETKVPKKDVTRALQSLACGKSSQRVLIKTPKSKEVIETDLFQVSFLSKFYIECITSVSNALFSSFFLQ